MAETIVDSVAAVADAALSSDHVRYRIRVTDFIGTNLASGMQGREALASAARAGLIGMFIPAEMGGNGGDLLHCVLLAEQMAKSSAGAGLGCLFETVVLNRLIVDFGTETQLERYMPAIANGDVVHALVSGDKCAVNARLDGEFFVLSGAGRGVKNGIYADLFYVVVADDAGKSVFILDATAQGLAVDAAHSIGDHEPGSAHLTFNNVRIAADALLGVRHEAEDTIVAPVRRAIRVIEGLTALATAERSFELCLAFTRERAADGVQLFDSQDTQFRLAEMKAILLMGQGFRASFLHRLANYDLDDVTAATIKYWMTNAAENIATAALHLQDEELLTSKSEIAAIWMRSATRSIQAENTERLKELIGHSI